jgi:hypothetical protein
MGHLQIRGVKEIEVGGGNPIINKAKSNYVIGSEYGKQPLKGNSKYFLI